jgi:hypothetical protein
MAAEFDHVPELPPIKEKARRKGMAKVRTGESLRS